MLFRDELDINDIIYHAANVTERQGVEWP